METEKNIAKTEKPTEYIPIKELGFGAIYQVNGIKYKVTKILSDNEVESVLAKENRPEDYTYTHEFSKGILEVFGYTDSYNLMMDSCEKEPQKMDNIVVFNKDKSNLCKYLGKSESGDWVLQDVITKEIFQTCKIPFISIENYIN